VHVDAELHETPVGPIDPLGIDCRFQPVVVRRSITPCEVFSDPFGLVVEP
jgi:hypothetical protein